MSESYLVNAVSGKGFSSSLGLLANNAKAQKTERTFAALIDGIKAATDDVTVNNQDTRLNGDYISSMALKNPTATDRVAVPSGAAANSGQKGTIDKTSKLYEQALELESYFVKIMLSSMRNTVTKTDMGGKNGFAAGMYEDMLYDELSRDLTKNAGFGLADQVYLQLSGQK